MLTEKEAWEYIAKNAVASSNLDWGNHIQFLGRHCHGLCSICINMRINGLITYTTRDKMFARIEQLPDVDSGTYKFPLTEAGMKERIEWCKKQSQ